ncbi:MAG TPA: hypothetical protein VGI19_02685 [Candidatus Cybelea sp.]|jgi:DNA-binding beta-propeller fold protein YncE
MKMRRLFGDTVALFAATAMLAGCSGVRPALMTPGTLPAVQQDGPLSSGSDLLYVSDDGPDVLIFTYPAGAHVATLKGFNGAQGECVDGSGDVWIADHLASEMVEYGHGSTKRKARLLDRGYYPQGCAIDPATGNLAVSNATGFHGSGDLLVYQGAHGKPERFTDPDFQGYYFCGYDNKGDLFVDGTGGGYNRYAVLRRGSQTLETIPLEQDLYVSGSVQWDGKYMTLGGWNGEETVLYQTKGMSGQVIGSIDLDKSEGANTFWIRNGTVVDSSCCGWGVFFYNYPAGGAPTKILRDRFYPYGVVVSSAGGSRR